MPRYLALLRGVNVGGKSLIKMADLRVALSESGFDSVKTYIQSGNVIFSSETDKTILAKSIEGTIKKSFKLDVAVTVFSAKEWLEVIEKAPSWWGTDKTWKHNILVMIGDHDMPDVMAEVGVLKPDIEQSIAGKRVVYQSLSLDSFGRTTGGKIASKPIYKQMTIRNYNTANRLLDILKDS